MKVYFTICSNNYLAQATVLGKSLRQFDPGTIFIVFLCDNTAPGIDYGVVANEVIPIGMIEPRVDELAAKYNIIELNTCVKPRVFEYLFNERNAEKAIFLDPDTRIYHSLDFLDQEMEAASIILTPHICTPIPLDGKQPAETTFLNFGLYNLGFIALRKTGESLRFLSWWKERTYLQGYIDVYKGIFVDQLPVNFVPLFFKEVRVLQDRGMNMAPWNLHERLLEKSGEGFKVNGTEWLKFYHFSNFRADAPELSFERYNRFSMHERPDLEPIYSAYGRELETAGYKYFSFIKSAYSLIHARAVKQQRLKKWINRLLLKKFFAGNKKR